MGNVFNNMTMKDCFYGQIRRIREHPDKICTWLPNNLSEFITKQEVLTWDNATGMNPFHADFDNLPNVPVEKMSYGQMLNETCDMDASCLSRRIMWELDSDVKKLEAIQFEKLIKEDYNNEFCAASKLLAAWWHIHHLLNRPDVLEYDYICLRQTDTLFDIDVDVEMFMEHILEKNDRVLERNNLNHQIPILYDFFFGEGGHLFWYPSANFIPSYAYILNRSAVKALRDNFYQLALNELNYYDTLLGRNNITMGKPGIVMHRIAVKSNVESISLPPMILNPQQLNRGMKPDGTMNDWIDYSSMDKRGTLYTGQHNKDK